MLHGIDPAIAQRLFNSIIEEKQPEPIELTWFLKDGTPRISEVRIGLFKKDGKIAGFTAVARDITENKKMEAEIQNLAKFPADNPNPILRLNRGSTLLYANEASRALLQHMKFKVNKTAPKFWRDLVTEVLTSRSNKNVEITLGRKTWSFLVAYIKGHNYVNIYARDITEQKQALRALIDSEEKFRSIVENSNDVVMLTLPDGIISYISPACFRVLGYNPEDLVGTRPSIFHPDDIEKVIKTLSKAVKGERGIDFEYRIITKAGETRWISHSWSPILENGKVKLIVSVVRGITERKKMEDDLKHERDMLEAVTENIGAGLTIISKDYHILWANKFLKQIFGDVEQKPCYSAYHKRDTICPDCGVKKVLESNAPFDTYEFPFTDDKGNTEWIELIVTPIKDSDGTVIAALELAVNITERKQLQNKLAEYSERLEKLVEKRTEQLKRTQAKLVRSERLATIGELAAMVGHDLRNPLTGIMGAAYYLKTKNEKEIGAKGKEMLETIEKAIKYSNKIINDLSEYSRDLKLKFTETTPKAMLQNALSSLEIPEKIQIADATEDKPMVKADMEKTCNVFVNIIQNAIDAIPEGGTLTIKSREAKGKLEITFNDTGTGMSEETVSKLKVGFPLFTTKAKGMGFGLPICRRIIEAHGGKLSVKSKAKKGTKITVTIPVNPKPLDEGEEKWIFNESMLSATLTAQGFTMNTKG